ncbi:ribose 5-phosphate isomerase B [Alicyclobacillus kakegawensis]|uniref:ribose 5-phosphate isomerase B n=1 Tax=Alicyclobacillus kakegawensis TaxID=392012 RepID=UPI00082BD8E5|nr:ribose 5-phosphate isomerase B [Alicyclobacillus kakegawensis]
MAIAIGSDDAGFHLKEILKSHLTSLGYEFVDFGCHSEAPVDYPDVAYRVAKAVQAQQFERAVLICGTGIGVAITANKVRGVRAAICHDTYSAERSRKSNNAQILTMGSRVVGPELAKVILEAWLNSEFQGGNSTRKLDKISEYEDVEWEDNGIDQKAHQSSGSSC